MKTKITTTLKELKAITTTYIGQLNIITKNIRDTYESDIEAIKEDLISRIAIEYSLDSTELKSKFLRRKKKHINGSNVENDDANNSDSEYMQSINNTSDLNQQLLIKHVYDNNNYYIEMIEGGKVYDTNKNEVGFWKNGQMELNMNLITQLRNIEVQISDLINKNDEPNKLLSLTNNDDNFCKVAKKINNDVPIVISAQIESSTQNVSIPNANIEIPIINANTTKNIVKRRVTKKVLTQIKN